MVWIVGMADDGERSPETSKPKKKKKAKPVNDSKLFL